MSWVSLASLKLLVMQAPFCEKEYVPSVFVIVFQTWLVALASHSNAFTSMPKPCCASPTLPTQYTHAHDTRHTSTQVFGST